LFEQERLQRQRMAQKRKKEIIIGEDEVEVLKAKLFKMRLDRARELKQENELIQFDTKNVSFNKFCLPTLIIATILGN
jgi:hypothetical protein